MAQSPSRYRPSTGRADWLLRLLLLGFAVILVRLFYIQIVRHEYYTEELAPLLDSRAAAVVPYPGSILGRNGEALAESILLTSVVADPKRMVENHESLEGAAEQLAPLLAVSASGLLGELHDHQDSHYLELARFVKRPVAEQIGKLRIKGLALVPEWKREYPQGGLACHLLGGRDRFHQPLSGLELQWRLLLDGEPGASSQGSDPLGLAADAAGPSLAASPGKDLVLTVDVDLQHHAENELDRMWRRERPKWAEVVVVDPRTGGVLVSAARPGYDPGLYVTGKPAPGCRWSPVPTALTRNIPVMESVEPGSTFKILLVAAALDKGVITPGSTFWCPGRIAIGGQPITCWGEWQSRGHGRLDIAGVLAQSCNVCAAQIALRLGAQSYHDFLRKAGLGSDPEAGFPAEEHGLMRPAEGTRARDLATMGFGQNVSCTALQLTSIVAGIVNGGIMKHAHVLDRVLNKDGSLFRQVPVSEQPLCSAQTSALIRQMMQYTVEHGTGRPALMPDFKVGAKTGTAQQWGLRSPQALHGPLHGLVHRGCPRSTRRAT